MRKLLRNVSSVLAIILNACTQEMPGDFVLVKGGRFMNHKSNYYQKKFTVPAFYICTHEVTQKEWMDVMGSDPSQFNGESLPVEMVSWYDCVDYCNKRSVKEGLNPYYAIDKDKKDSGNSDPLDATKWVVTIIHDANGYRLPTEIEWEYAAGCGQLCKSYIYRGRYYMNSVSSYC